MSDDHCYLSTELLATLNVLGTGRKHWFSFHDVVVNNLISLCSQGLFALIYFIICAEVLKSWSARFVKKEKYQII